MAGIDAEKIAQEAINAIAEKIKNLNTLNIIVAGKTGVGKSTLINAVFKSRTGDTTTDATYNDWYKTVYVPVAKTTQAANGGK